MKNRIQVTTIIFDLDGTLIDTELSAAQAVQTSFTHWNIQLNPEDATFVTGRTWESAFDYLFRKYPLPVAESIAKEKILDRYRKTLENELSIVPGSVKAVESLAAEYSLGLVSGSNRKEILWALEKLEIKHHFQVILGAEDYPRSKPNPDGYLKAMKELNVNPSECLIFEDSNAGLTSAKAAGAWVVAITSTNHFSQDLTLANVRIPDLTCVNAEWVKNLSFD